MADNMSKRLDQKGRTPSVKKTRKMPSGAQQYVRGKTTVDRLDTLIDLDRGSSRSSKMPFGPERQEMFDMERGRTDAFIDESRKSSEDYRKKKARGYKDGGAVSPKGSSVRLKTRAERKKRSASYNQTPDMPEEKGKDEFSRGRSFLPGVGGGWSAAVGKRRTRYIDANAKEKNRNMSDNYGQGTFRPPKEYRDGGAVCQGGGKAMAGTKFRGVR